MRTAIEHDTGKKIIITRVLNFILTYGEPSSVSVFTTTGGVFPWRQRGRKQALMTQSHQRSSNMTLKAAKTAKSDDHSCS